MEKKYQNFLKFLVEVKSGKSPECLTTDYAIISRKQYNKFKNHKDPESEIVELMREFFNNKRLIRELKQERIDLWNNGDCLNLSESNDVDCIRRQRETFSVELCDFCKKRHSIYLRLREINMKNTGILKTVKSKINNCTY